MWLDHYWSGERVSVPHSHSETFLIIIPKDKDIPPRVLQLQLDTQIPRVTHITSHSSLASTSPVAPTATRVSKCFQYVPEAVGTRKHLVRAPMSANSSLKGGVLSLEIAYLLAPEILKSRCWMSRGEVEQDSTGWEVSWDGDLRGGCCTKAKSNW